MRLHKTLYICVEIAFTFSRYGIAQASLALPG